MIRRLAWQLLVDGGPTPLRGIEALAIEHALDARDRGLLRRIVATEVRRRGTLRALVRTLATGRPRREIALLLHVGLVQLFFLDKIPDHAAVSETVEVARERLGESSARYVNAVLRESIRARRVGASGDPRRDLVGRELHLEPVVFADPKEHPLLWAEDALSMPAPLMKRWTKRHGEEQALELARIALEEPDLSLRVRTSLAQTERVTRDVLLTEFTAAGIAVRAGLHPDVLLAASDETESVLANERFVRGELSVQGETALRAAELVAARPGERVLDLCAAPGGKTAVLAETGADVVACDVDETRLARLRSTLERLGLAARVEVRLVSRADALELGRFDAVLVDAPCSNSGVLAGRPEARWRFERSELGLLENLQAGLLARASAAVAPAGRLVYSTCSLEPEEDGRQVRSFLASHPEFTLAHELFALPAARGSAGPIDGGYAALLCRAGA